MTDQFLIEKRGLYYRPNAQGYTGLKRCAGRYSFEEAAEHVGPNGPDGSQDGMSMWHEDEAPEYAPACYRDIRDREEGRKEGLAEAASEIERLTALLQSSSEMLHEAAVEFDAIHPGAGIAETIRYQISRIKEPRNDQ